MSNISQNDSGLTGDSGIGIERVPETDSEVIRRRLAGRDGVPLSLAQQTLWAFHQLTPQNALHNLSLSISIKGALNVAVLERSINEIVRRHEILRTTFSIVEGQPRQIIEPALRVSAPIIDLTHYREGEREHESARIAGEEARRGFDLARGPLLRAALVRMSIEDHVLLLTTHRMICDDGSMQVFFRELTVLYEAFSHDQSSPLPNPPIQYTDFSVWQKEWLRGQIIQTQLSYWKKQLENVSALELPADRPRPADRSFHGERECFALPHELAREIRAFSTEHDVTVFMTLLAVFQLLLRRYTGQTDITVGSPIATRRRRDIENAIGLFANTWVLRSDLSGNPTFTKLLSQVREMVLEAYANQDVPVEKLAEELRPSGDESGMPLFQVMFALQKSDFAEMEMSGLKMHSAKIHNGAAEFDLNLSMIYDDAWNISGFLEYGTDLFDRATISRLLGHFQTLLKSVIANPNQRIAEIPLLTETERQQLLVKWNDNAREYPKDKCIHALFEDQVEKTPDAPAVVFNRQQLSYRELNARANQLAHYLQRSGVGPETLVGICMERSIELVVALLGVLKAGGAFVPMDTAYPKERLAFILQDTQVSALLTESRLLSQFPEYGGNQVCLDQQWQSFSEEGEENPRNEVTPDNLAYVIYTSGSTGRPKGVMIEHRSAGAFLAWARSVFGADELSGVLAATSICFDLSIFELFAPLTSGGKVILAESVLSLATPHSVPGVTLINTVPSIMAELVRLRTIPPSIHTLNLAGEPLKTNLVREIYDTSLAKRVYDLYGPSEATTYSTWTLRAADGPQTIGRPIANTQIYLLDNQLQPVLVGAPGEIYIGGDGLARGYLNRPELTAEKFVSNPFSSAPGARLYRTGDRARYRPDGTIEFLGRIDEQVKIRGYRIELGEIEAAVAAHPAVREAVVMAREDAQEIKRLVAYVVLNRDSSLPTRELRGFLRQQLPQYMVPGAFVYLDSVPITPNGKVDRKALPLPDQSKIESEESFVAPRNPLEERLANIWSKVLKLDRIGIHDNFLELGGQSLFAVRIVSEIETTLKKRLPLAALFQFPTIAEIAGVLAEENSTARPLLVAVQPLGSKPPLFFVYGDYAYSRLVPWLDPGQPFYGFPRPLIKATRRIRIEHSAAEYVKQLCTVQPQGPYFIAGHSIGGLIAFEMAQQLHKQGEKVALIALFDPTVPGPANPVATNNAGNKIRQHTHNLAGMSTKAKLAYAANWIEGQIEFRIGRPYKRLLCEIYHLIHKPLPPELERFYIGILFGKIFHDAATNYTGKVYPGRMVYFKSETDKSESLTAWQRLAGDQLEVYEMSGNHQSMLLEPHVKNLAQKLTQCLVKAQRGEYMRSLIFSVPCLILEWARWHS